MKSEGALVILLIRIFVMPLNLQSVCHRYNIGNQTKKIEMSKKAASLILKTRCFAFFELYRAAGDKLRPTVFITPPFVEPEILPHLTYSQ